MAIKPLPPVPGLIKYDYRHGDDFVPPAHLIKQGRGQDIDPSMLPKVQVDTTYDEDEILANQSAERVLPVFVGLRTALATRSIERANNRLQGLSRLQGVSHHIGRSILAGNSYMDKGNLNRPSTKEELRTARKLGKINTKRRRAGARIYATSRNLTPPVSASRAESREASRNVKEHDKTISTLSKYDRQFMALTRNPEKKADRVIARRNRAVARREALDQAADRRAEKMRQVRDELTGSARALGQEVAEQHQDSLDLTKEQMRQLRNTTAYKSGQLAVKGTVALGKFYKEAGQNAGKLYLQGGKYVAKKIARRDSTVKTELKSGIKELEESLKLPRDPRFNEELINALEGPANLSGSGESITITGYHGTERVGDHMNHYIEYEDSNGNKNFTTLGMLLWSHLPAERQEEIKKAGLDPYALDGLFDPIFEPLEDK